MKINLFIDFDNTIVNTTKAVVEVYNEKFNANINYLDIENYNLTPYIKNIDEKERSKLFCEKEMYSKLKPYEGVFDVLNKLKESNLFNIYLVTNCAPKSIPYKVKWLEENNFDQLFSGKIYLDITGCQGYNKSIINMENSILIDDHRENHLSSNAKYKLSFKYNDKQNWGPDPSKGDSVWVFKNWNNGIYYYLEHIAKNHISGKICFASNKNK